MNANTNFINKYLQNELRILLNKYLTTIPERKKKKHFPAIYKIPFNDLYKKTNREKRSISLSSKPINEQIEFIVTTIDCKINMTNYLYNNYPKYLIKKFTGNEITNKFPEFTKKRIKYITIYYIKTENIHYFYDLNNNTFCDIILVCINDKNECHIMFYYDNKNPYYSNIQLTNTDKMKNHAEMLYNDTTF